MKRFDLKACFIGFIVGLILLVVLLMVTGCSKEAFNPDMMLAKHAKAQVEQLVIQNELLERIAVALETVVKND